MKLRNLHYVAGVDTAYVSDPVATRAGRIGWPDRFIMGLMYRVRQYRVQVSIGGSATINVGTEDEEGNQETASLGVAMSSNSVMNALAREARLDGAFDPSFNGSGRTETPPTNSAAARRLAIWNIQHGMPLGVPADYRQTDSGWPRRESPYFSWLYCILRQSGTTSGGGFLAPFVCSFAPGYSSTPWPQVLAVRTHFPDRDLRELTKNLGTPIVYTGRIEGDPLVYFGQKAQSVTGCTVSVPISHPQLGSSWRIGTYYSEVNTRPSFLTTDNSFPVTVDFFGLQLFGWCVVEHAVSCSGGGTITFSVEEEWNWPA